MGAWGWVVAKGDMPPSSLGRWETSLCCGYWQEGHPGFNPCVCGSYSPERSPIFEAVVMGAGWPGWDLPCPGPH